MPKTLAALMICRNEANNFLEKVIVNTLRFADIIYVLDDHSTDNSSEIYAKYYPKVKVIQSEYSWEDGENILRKEINDYAINDSHPDFCIGIDGDDFHLITRGQIEELMSQDEYDWYGFRWYDMWGSEEYYKLPIGYAPRMYRVNCVQKHIYPEQKYHVFQVPQNIITLNGYYTDYKIKHLGYVTKENQMKHYIRKTQIEDPDRILFPDEEYQKILQEHELVEWVD